jgi:hypothetical protein
MDRFPGSLKSSGNTYKLTVPLPVPGKLFWSVTVYDAQSRSQIQTEQKKVALRCLFELKDTTGRSVDLHFSPAAPKGKQDRWIKTISAKAGAFTSASTVWNSRPLTAHGSRKILRKPSEEMKSQDRI